LVSVEAAHAWEVSGLRGRAMLHRSRRRPQALCRRGQRGNRRPAVSCRWPAMRNGGVGRSNLVALANSTRGPGHPMPHPGVSLRGLACAVRKLRAMRLPEISPAPSALTTSPHLTSTECPDAAFPNCDHVFRSVQCTASSVPRSSCASSDASCRGFPPKEPATLLQSRSPRRPTAPRHHVAAMTTAVANPSIPAHHPAPSPNTADGVGSSRTYAAIAPSTSSPHQATPSRLSKLPHHDASPPSSSDASAFRADGKRSPLSYVV